MKEIKMQLFDKIVNILEQARGNVVRAVNSNMVLAYWLIGREIVEEVQQNKNRAEYGKQVLKELSEKLTKKYGTGFSETNLGYFRQFYLAFKNKMEIHHPSGGKSETSSLLNDTEAISYPVGGKLENSKSYLLGSLSHKGRPLGDESGKQKFYPVGRKFENSFKPNLSWSHYRALMRVKNEKARLKKLISAGDEEHFTKFRIPTQQSGI